MFSITESWLTEVTKYRAVLCCPRGVNFISCNQPTRGGGIILLFSTIFDGSVLKKCFTACFENLVVSLKQNNRHVAIIVVYRIPGTAVTNFLDELSRILNFYSTNYEEVICFGDFNVAANKGTANFKLLNVILNQLIYQ